MWYFSFVHLPRLLRRKTSSATNGQLGGHALRVCFHCIYTFYYFRQFFVSNYHKRWRLQYVPVSLCDHVSFFYSFNCFFDSHHILLECKIWGKLCTIYLYVDCYGRYWSFAVRCWKKPRSSIRIGGRFFPIHSKEQAMLRRRIFCLHRLGQSFWTNAIRICFLGSSR